MTTVRTQGRAMSVPGGMALSVIISMGVTVLTSLWIAYLLDAEKISWHQAGYWILAMLFLSAFLGAKGAIATIKHQRLVVAIMSGVLYWGFLLCLTALFFGGNYEAVPETAGVITAGSACAAMLSLPKKVNGRRKIKLRKL